MIINSIIKILSVSCVFFLKLFYFILLIGSNFIQNLKDRIQFTLLMLFIGEERLLNKFKTTIKSPRNIGIILSKESFSSIHRNILKLFYWNILLDIKIITIYDPFGILNVLLLRDSISDILNKHSILFISDKIYDCRNKREIRNIDYNCKYDYIITIISFNNANNQLIERIIGKYNLPIQYDYFNIKFSSIYDQNDYKNFLTKKNAEYLPEILFFFGDEEICLYGFPFTLLENCEILKTGKMQNIDINKYLNNFIKYTKIEKRYGK